MYLEAELIPSPMTVLGQDTNNSADCNIASEGLELRHAITYILLRQFDNAYIASGHL